MKPRIFLNDADKKDTENEIQIYIWNKSLNAKNEIVKTIPRAWSDAQRKRYHPR